MNEKTTQPLDHPAEADPNRDNPNRSPLEPTPRDLFVITATPRHDMLDT